MAQVGQEVIATRSAVGGPEAAARLRGDLTELIGQVGHEVIATRHMVEGRAGAIVEILQLLYDGEPRQRERLRLLRTTPEYEEAFSAPDPLVTVAIPTYDGYRELVGRALPSVLAQTYPNIEVIVVGDAAPPETGRLIAELDDGRITYVNLNRRGPYPADDRRRWLVAGVPPYNEAVARARGLWIAPLDDDDAFAPNHVERLLTAARAGRYEVCYGRLRQLHPDGSEKELGVFPPELNEFGLQAAIYHAGLRFFELELADALFGLPYDWAMCRRMLRAGVRFGMVDAPVVDYYPSQLWKTARP